MSRSPSNQRVTKFIQDVAHDLADFVLTTQRSGILKISPYLSEHGLTYAQFILLAFLSTEHGLSMSNIAKLMGHSTAATTGMIDKLNQLGYIQRCLSATDRRKILVKITAKGDLLVDEVHKILADQLAELLCNTHNNDTLLQAKILLHRNSDSKP